jgi:hypothetical protein
MPSKIKRVLLEVVVVAVVVVVGIEKIFSTFIWISQNRI